MPMKIPSRVREKYPGVLHAGCYVKIERIFTSGKLVEDVNRDLRKDGEGGPREVPPSIKKNTIAQEKVQEGFQGPILNNVFATTDKDLNQLHLRQLISTTIQCHKQILAWHNYATLKIRNTIGNKESHDFLEPMRLHYFSIKMLS